MGIPHGRSGGRKKAVAVFVAADDYDDTGEALAIIRGQDGGRKMFDIGDVLPPAYSSFRTEVFRDRIIFKSGYSYHKPAVLAPRNDPITMLRHVLIQVDLRGL